MFFLFAVRLAFLLFAATTLVGFNRSAKAQPFTSEEFIARTWTTAEGLPNNSVTAVLQTSDGYLWVGTQSGLVKFDGVSFKSVKLNYATNGEVRITDMCEDHQGRIWIGTELLGLFCYSNGIVNRTEADKISSPITTLALGENNDLWVGTRKGLGLWNGTTLRWFTSEDGLPEESISSVCVARSGKVWITARSGIYLYQQGQLGKYHFTTDGQGRNPEFLGIFEDQQRELWAFGDTYLIKLGEGRRFNYFRNGQISSARIWSFYEARDGRLWIGTSGKGLFQFTGEGFRPVVFRNGTVPNDVRSIYQDRERNIWLGTDGGGLVQLRQENLRLLGEPEGLPGAQASGIAQNASNQIVISYLDNGAFVGDGEHFLPFGPAELGNAQHFIQTLCVATNGDTWFGSASAGLLCLHGNQVIHFDSDSSLAGDAVNYLHASAGNSVWAGTAAGGVYLCGQADPQPLGNVEAPVTAMLATGTGNLFVGTAAGTVWRWSDGIFSPVVARPEASMSAITSLCQDSEGRIWMSSVSNGLYCWHNQNLTAWPTIEDQPGLRVFGLINDLDDNLWLATSRGIELVEKPELNQAIRTRAFRMMRIVDHFSTPDDRIFGGPGTLRTKDGLLWFILQGHVLQVDPRVWRPQRISPAIYLESINVNGLGLRQKVIEPALNSDNGKRSVQLPSGVRSLDLDFTTPCLTEPEQTRFRYQLEGFDSGWVEGDPRQRHAHYGNLPAGKYRFHLIAANSDGTWNKDGVFIAFIVPLPWWRQLWVVALMILTLAGLVGWVVRFVSHRRLRLRLSRLERSEEMSRERMRIAQDMHDEIGSKLARISYLSESVKAELKGYYNDADVINSLAKTARDLLQSLDRMVWAVNPRNDTLENLASYLNRHASEYFQNTPIECQLSIPNNLPALPLSAEIRHNLFLAFEETLTNAIKHSQASRVNVLLAYDAGRLQITISDNGSGFDSDDTTSATGPVASDRMGLTGIQRRLQAIGGECEIISRFGQGTTVKLTLQLTPVYAR